MQKLKKLYPIPHLSSNFCPPPPEPQRCQVPSSPVEIQNASRVLVTVDGAISVTDVASVIVSTPRCLPQKSRSQFTRRPSLPRIRISSLPHIRISSLPHIRISSLHHIRISSLHHIRINSSSRVTSTDRHILVSSSPSHQLATPRPHQLVTSHPASPAARGLVLGRT